jgi:hypothetical protein
MVATLALAVIAPASVRAQPLVRATTGGGAAPKPNAAQAALASAAPPTAGDNASRFDGAWVATHRCSEVGRPPPPFTRSGGIVVRGAEFTVVRGIPGQPGCDIASGRVARQGPPLTRLSFARRLRYARVVPSK